MSKQFFGDFQKTVENFFEMQHFPLKLILKCRHYSVVFIIHLVDNFGGYFQNF